MESREISINGKDWVTIICNTSDEFVTTEQSGNMEPPSFTWDEVVYSSITEQNVLDLNEGKETLVNSRLLDYLGYHDLRLKLENKNAGGKTNEEKNGR